MTVATKDIAEERALLTFAYEAFNRRDLESVLALMHPEVEWPNGMEGGWIRGREAVRAYWKRQLGMIVSQVEPLGIHADDDGRVVVEVHQVVRDLAGAVILDRTVRHAYVIEDGLIRTMEIRE